MTQNFAQKRVEQLFSDYDSKTPTQQPTSDPFGLNKPPQANCSGGLCDISSYKKKKEYLDQMTPQTDFNDQKQWRSYEEYLQVNRDNQQNQQRPSLNMEVPYSTGVTIKMGNQRQEYSSAAILYQTVLNYFGNLQMRKEKIENTSSIYFAKIYCGTCSTLNRYLIVFVTDLAARPIGTIVPLSSLKYYSIHTRALPYDNRMKPQEISQRLDDFSKAEITQVNVENDGTTIYTHPTMSCTIKILPNKQREYAMKGTLAMAFETYNTAVYCG